jgi:hypothetical protein
MACCHCSLPSCAIKSGETPGSKLVTSQPCWGGSRGAAQARRVAGTTQAAPTSKQWWGGVQGPGGLWSVHYSLPHQRWCMAGREGFGWLVGWRGMQHTICGRAHTEAGENLGCRRHGGKAGGSFMCVQGGASGSRGVIISSIK